MIEEYTINRFGLFSGRQVDELMKLQDCKRKQSTKDAYRQGRKDEKAAPTLSDSK